VAADRRSAATEWVLNLQYNIKKSVSSTLLTVLVPMELDIYVPSLGLALEYQGEQHYGNNPKFGNTASVRKRDQQKEIACKEYGITLIPVKFTWKKDQKSIAEWIQAVRPDLIDSKEKVP
jgi:hypothetical protein